ncbi:uncharacterized protein DUF4402 [Sphingomonas sp. F9_3S_D5_B_2]
MAFAASAPASAAPTATVSATIVKPLTLTWLKDLNLGSIVLGPGTWSNAKVSISQAGVLSCTNANVTCMGVTSVAQYNVVGTNKQTVHINVPNVTMVNQSDATKTVTLTVDSPTSLTLANSGQPGSNFSIGGSVTVSSTSPDGLYTGTFNVTVDY